MTSARRDMVTGLLFGVFAVVFYAFSHGFTGQMVMESVTKDVGPTFLPRILLIALALESLFLIVNSARKYRLAAADGQAASQEPDGFWQARPWLLLAIFVAYIFLAVGFGYLIATLIFLVAGFGLLGERKWWQLLIMPPVITLSIYYLFENLLGIWLPKSEFF